MRIVLKPYWIAEECFLWEAFLWGAFYRFPLSEIMPDCSDFRFDENCQEEYSPYIPDNHGYIESEEAIRVGLPSNPEWDSLLEANHIPEIWFFNHDLSNPSNSFVEQITGKSIREEDQKNAIKLAFADLYPDMNFEETKKEALRRSEEQNQWNEKYEDYAETIKAKIFLALREGKIAASGRPIPENIEEIGSYNWTDFEHIPIPADYWKLDGIDWEQSASNNKKGHYCHICVNTEQLMSVFPSPNSEQAKSVQIVADQYVLNEGDIIKPIPKGNRGRPSKDWDSFYNEVISRIYEDKVPDKQEAFISDMQEWCVEHWGKSPGRSTILEKINKFHNRHVKQLKNVRN